MATIQELCPKQINLNCADCLIISGCLIEPCQDCLRRRFMEEVDSEDEEAAPVIRKKKELTKKEIEIKEYNKRMAIARREEKIRAAEERKRAQKQAIFDKLILSETSKFVEFDSKHPNSIEHEILCEIANNNLNRDLTKHNRYFGGIMDQNATRGPRCHPEIANLCTYNKPEGFFGIALPVKAGSWLGNDGNDNEWIVAYHGTGLEAVRSILASELRAGPGQSFKNCINRNPLSAQGPNDIGIFCTPDIPEAVAHNRARNFVVILQCRVNPRALKVADNLHWVVNQGKDIIPYRLLIKPR